MAGRWRYDGEIKTVHASGLYDVYLQDAKITLTNKPPDEVKPAAHNSKEERYDIELAQAKAALHAPAHTAARAVRTNQSRACCLILVVMLVTLAFTSFWSFTTAFSLIPQPGQHPSGMCELCVYKTRIYGRRQICNFWPEDSPRCHEDFLPWIYYGAFAGVFAMFTMLFLWMAGRSILCDGKELAELTSYTFHQYMYPCCDTLGWLSAWWCCGDRPSPRELREYEAAQQDLKNAEQGKPLLDQLERSDA